MQNPYSSSSFSVSSLPHPSVPSSPIYSLPHPEKSWAGGNPTILSDEDVERWLDKNAPDAAREIHREARAVREQHDSESQLGAVSAPFGHEVTDYANVGTPVSDLTLPDPHWAYLLYPGCGSQEICDLLKSILSPARHDILRLAFAEGLEHKEIALRYGCTRAAVTLRLSAIRKTLFGMLLSQTLPRPIETKNDETDIALLFAADTERSGTPYISGRIKNAVEARVCDCGRHLGRRHLDHRRIEPGRERTLRCDFCAKTFPESQWPLLAA